MGPMATNDNDIRIDIEGDASGLKAGVADANVSLDALSQTFRQPAAAMEAMNKQGDAFVASLRRQVDTFGMTRGQVFSYDAQIRGLTGAHLESANALGKQLDALEANEKMMGRMKIAVAAVAAAATAAIVVLIKQSADLAARYETMGVVMGVAGNNAGYTRAEMFALEKQMQATGISMIKSREALTSMATANIDLAKATGLARAAQDLAVVANINSSDALVRMVQGIKSGEVEILKTMGLNVSFEASYKDLAASLGINTSALSEQQKMMARTDAVMEGSARYAGIYEESMTTAGKAINSLSRYWEDFKVKAGAAFLPTLTTSVFGLTDALKAANAELSKTGSVVTIDSIGRGLDTAFRTVFETVAVLGANAVFVLSAIGREIGGIAAQAAAVVRLDFAGARQIGKDMRADAEASRAALDAFEKRIMTRPTAAPASASGAGEAARIAAGGAATVQGTSMDPAAAKASADAAKKIRDVIEALKFEAAQLGRSAEAQELYNRLKQAGVSIGSQAGQQIKALTEDLTRQQAVLSALDREFDEAVKGQEAMTQAFDAARMAERIEAEKLLTDQVDRLNASLNAKADAESDAMAAANALIKGYEDETALLGLSNNERALAIALRELETQKTKLTSEALEDYTKRLTAAVQGNQFAKAAKDLDAYLNPAKAKSFGDALSNAFGKAGTAIGKMAGAFDNYAQAQAEFNEKMKALSPEDRIKNETKLSQKQAEIQVNAYADMAGAAKTFFDEGSTGYKVLSAAEQGFRAIQLAMSIAAMIQGTAETTTSVAQSGTKAAASTTAGVAKAFEQMGVWGFVGAAAIIAFMASMGVRGGSGVSMSAQRQESQGAGTVLGDSSAKSNSLANSLEMLTDINELTMQYSARMAKSLQNIEIALTGVSSMIFRTPGLTSGNLSGIQEMSKSGFLGFSGKKVSVTDSGLTYKGSLSGIEDGLQAYTDVTTTKKKWWGLSKSSSTQTVMSDADDDISRQFGLIFQSISDSLVAAGGVLGNSADILETQIANIEIDLGMVSLKGLKGDELEDALNAVISASADDIAKQVLPGLEKYQKVGEGYYETAIRVAYSTEVVQASLKGIGKGFDGAAMDIVDFSQTLIDAFGGLEELTEGIAEYYDAFYSDAEKFADSTVQLSDAFADLGLAMPDSKAAFRDLVNGVDLTTDAGADLFASLMDLAPAFSEVSGHIEGLVRDINGMFADTIEDIRLSVLSPEQQYDYWRTKIDADMALLMNATDPDEIARLSGNIDSGVSSAYGLLDEDQQKALAPEFIAYLEESDAIATERLLAAQDNIVAAYTESARVIEEAMLRAAATLQAAADTSLAAAQTPIAVAVTVEGNASAEVGR